MPMTEKDVQISGNLRVLFMSPPKHGKSTVALTTLPPPIYVINADPEGLLAPARHGAKFSYDDCFMPHPIAAFQKAINHVEQTQRDPKKRYASVVIDTASFLSMHIVAEVKARGLDGFDLWREVQDVLVSGFARLWSLNAHVVACSHAILDASGEAGSMGHEPMIQGKTKNILVGMCNEVIWLEVTPGPSGSPAKAKREFLLGPQGNWKHGCRSLKASEGKISADFRQLIKMIRGSGNGSK
jgi:hypothetical protein